MSFSDETISWLSRSFSRAFSASRAESSSFWMFETRGKKSKRFSLNERKKKHFETNVVFLQSAAAALDSLKIVAEFLELLRRVDFDRRLFFNFTFVLKRKFVKNIRFLFVSSTVENFIQSHLLSIHCSNQRFVLGKCRCQKYTRNQWEFDRPKKTTRYCVLSEFINKLKVFAIALY